MYSVGWRVMRSNKARYGTVACMLSIVLAMVLYQIGSLSQNVYQGISVLGSVATADIWVMHPQANAIEDRFPVSIQAQSTLESLDGVYKVSPVVIGNAQAALPKAKMQRCTLVGMQPEGFRGFAKLLEGQVSHLDQPRTAVLDKQSLRRFMPTRFLRRAKFKWGSHIKVNDRILRVVGLFDKPVARSQIPTIYLHESLAREILGIGAESTLFYAVSVFRDVDLARVCQQIAKHTGLKALTHNDFVGENWSRYAQQPFFMQYFWSILLSCVGLMVLLVLVLLRHFSPLHIQHLLILRALGASCVALWQIMLVSALSLSAVSWFCGILGYCILNYEWDMVTSLSLIDTRVYGGAFLYLAFVSLVSSGLSIARLLYKEEELIHRL